MGLTSYRKLNHYFNVSHLQYANMRIRGVTLHLGTNRCHPSLTLPKPDEYTLRVQHWLVYIHSHSADVHYTTPHICSSIYRCLQRAPLPPSGSICLSMRCRHSTCHKRRKEVRSLKGTKGLAMTPERRELRKCSNIPTEFQSDRWYQW